LKDPTEILVRARELVQAEQERRLNEAQARLPRYCTHNHRQMLDSRSTIVGERNPTYNRISCEGVPTIGLCLLGADSPEEWQGTICEDPVDAQRCPYFNTINSKENVLTSLREDLTTPEWVAVHMPELSALLWVLEDTAIPKLSWFRRLLLHFHKFKVEPLRPAVDLEKLLSEYSP
jgi:hypothetical protein